MANLAITETIKPPSPSILVVDDEDDIRYLLTRWLTDEGFGCECAADAQAALEQLGLREIDIVALDIRMPKRSGIELLHTIKDVSPDTAVVMLTALEDAKMAIKALSYGACGCLIKPVDRKELLFQVENAFERRQQSIEKRQYTRDLEERVQQQTIAIRLAHEETVHRLVGASMYREDETAAHIRRTGLFSELLARAAGWCPQSADTIRLAAPMHDVGKIGIPEAILCKPGKLTDREFEVMKTHTVLGAKMLSDSNTPMLRMAEEIALNHHERWDGSGYPAGLEGADIPESARIVAIVDVYDALTHDRVHRAALPENEALAVMGAGIGTQFDPQLMASFFSQLPEIRRIAEHTRDELEQNAELNSISTPTSHLTPPCANSL